MQDAEFPMQRGPKAAKSTVFEYFSHRETQALGRPTPQTSILCANYRKYITDAQFSYAARTQSSKNPLLLNIFQ